MKYTTFEELQKQIQQLYGRSDYQAALEVAIEHASEFPEQVHLLAYWQAALSARTGSLDAAVEYLNRMIQTGFWYSQAILRNSPSFKVLQGLPAFEALVERNQLNHEAEHNQVFPLLTLRSEGRCQAGGEQCPLLIALHANASTAQASIDFWRTPARNGWLTAMPQSTQALWQGAYIWDDQGITSQEIRKHYHTLVSQYAVDGSRVILAGRSLGAEMAAWLALSAVIPVEGFIAVNPAGPMTSYLLEWQQFLEANPLPGLRGYVIWGENDSTIPQENLPGLVELFNNAGIETEFEALPGAGHEFCVEYEDSLMRGLNFIESG